MSESTVAIRLRARLAELMRTTEDRHQLPIATPEYLAALEREMALIGRARTRTSGWSPRSDRPV